MSAPAPERPLRRELLPHAPAAPLAALVAVAVVAALAARVLVGERPGLGLAVLALAVAAAVVVVRRPFGADRGPRGWQLVHGSAAVLLASAAALRDAGWVVALDLLAALLLGALALAPAGPERA